MNESRSQRSFGTYLVAGAVVLIAGWIVLHFLIHIVLWFASVLIVILAIAGLIWAVRVLL